MKLFMPALAVNLTFPSLIGVASFLILFKSDHPLSIFLVILGLCTWLALLWTTGLKFSTTSGTWEKKSCHDKTNARQLAYLGIGAIMLPLMKVGAGFSSNEWLLVLLLAVILCFSMRFVK